MTKRQELIQQLKNNKELLEKIKNDNKKKNIPLQQTKENINKI